MTGSFLDEVVPRVREAIASATYDAGVPARRPKAPASFKAAVQRESARGALVVEYKRRSPGARSPLPEPRSVPEFLAATAVEGVVAYSCLATGYGFDGSPAHVADLAGRTELPVLFKEFVLEERQLEVAARTGASAVLLIARLERAGALRASTRDLARRAHELGLEVLLELHDPAELSQVDGVSADVFGVNTRDLGALAFDRPRAYATLERAADLGLRPLLGLSGVEGPQEAREFWTRGCDGLLVGSAVARAAQPGRFLASLRRVPGEAGP